MAMAAEVVAAPAVAARAAQLGVPREAESALPAAGSVGALELAAADEGTTQAPPDRHLVAKLAAPKGAVARDALPMVATAAAVAALGRVVDAEVPVAEARSAAGARLATGEVAEVAEVAEAIGASVVAGVLQEAKEAEEAVKLAEAAAWILRREQLRADRVLHKSLQAAVKNKKMGDFRLAVKAEIMFMAAGDHAEERRERDTERQLERGEEALARMALAAEECVAAALDDVLACAADAPAKEAGI